MKSIGNGPIDFVSLLPNSEFMLLKRFHCFFKISFLGAIYLSPNEYPDIYLYRTEHFIEHKP